MNQKPLLAFSGRYTHRKATDMTETQIETEAEAKKNHENNHLSADAQRDLAYQRELSRLIPGSLAFKALKKSMRAGRVFRQHMACWPKKRADAGRGRR